MVRSTNILPMLSNCNASHYTIFSHTHYKPLRHLNPSLTPLFSALFVVFSFSPLSLVVRSLFSPSLSFSQQRDHTKWPLNILATWLPKQWTQNQSASFTFKGTAEQNQEQTRAQAPPMPADDQHTSVERHHWRTWNVGFRLKINRRQWWVDSRWIHILYPIII